MGVGGWVGEGRYRIMLGWCMGVGGKGIGMFGGRKW